MFCAALEVRDIYNVLTAMQKNLECPICLDLIKEPVATRCDHIFCRFCMTQLLGKKKRGKTLCPMCKTEVTRRSLQESPRFKMMIEGLLKVIHAFELDSGYKWFDSPDDLLMMAENLEEDGPPVLPKPEEHFDAELEEDKESGILNCQEIQKPGGEEMAPSDLAECGFSERDLDSLKSNLLYIDDPAALSKEATTESHLFSVNVGQREADKIQHAVDFSESVTDSENIQPDCKNLNPELQMQLNKRETLTNIDNQYDQDSSLLSGRKNSDNNENGSSSTSRKRMKRSLKRVNEWLQKTELCHFSTWDENPVDDDCDKSSCTSDETDIIPVLPVRDRRIELENPSTKTTVEDKIFGKTYKRHRKSNPRLTVVADVHCEEPTEPSQKDTNSNIRLKRKRKVGGLEPEDFIKKTNKIEPNVKYLSTQDICRLDDDDDDNFIPFGQNNNCNDSFYSENSICQDLVKPNNKLLNAGPNRKPRERSPHKKWNRTINPSSQLAVSLSLKGACSVRSPPNQQQIQCRRSRRLRLSQKTTEQIEDPTKIQDTARLSKPKKTSKKKDNTSTNIKPCNTQSSDEPLSKRFPSKSSDHNHEVEECETEIGSLVTVQINTDHIVKTGHAVAELSLQGSDSNCAMADMSSDDKKCLSPSAPVAETALQENNVEVDDSELDTQHLLKMFKGVKRSSFILEANPATNKDKENLAPVSLAMQTAGSVFNKNNVPDGHRMITTLEMSSKPMNRSRCSLRGRPSANVTEQNYKNDLLHNPQHQLSLIQANPIPKQSFSDEKTHASSSDGSKSLCETANHQALNGNNTMDVESQLLELNRINHSGSSKIWHPDPAVSKRETEKEIHHLENPQTKDSPLHAFDEELDTISSNGSPGVRTGNLLGHVDFSVESAVKCPNNVLAIQADQGLLCSARPDEDCGVADKSVVYGNGKINTCNDSRASSPSLISQELGKTRKRWAHKLDSSEEEDEDLPCFEAMLFAKSPLSPNLAVPLNSSGDSTVKQQGGGVLAMFSSNSISGKSSEMLTMAALPCLSQESVNLFSSQSNVSEPSVNGTSEHKQNASQPNNCENGTTERDERRLDEENAFEEQGNDQNQAEISECESETSQNGDSSGLSSQGEILNTQQRDAMQNNLEKLQQEMAALEAALEQQGTDSLENVSQCTATPEDVTIIQQETKEKKTDHAAADQCKNNKSSVSQSHGTTRQSYLECPTGNKAPSTPHREQNKTWTSPRQRCRPKLRTASPTFESPKQFKIPATVNNAVPSTQKNVLIVTSGLSQSDLMVVRKFARKTQSVFSSQVTESTTHIIMKTDVDLVCERTLKYFLGIAGRKWVVSYEWIVQSFREGRILDEYDFEVKGDVVNGRNHRGPRRSRLGSDGLLMEDFEICCHGSFTDMTRDDLERIISQCGAHVVNGPQMFKPNPKITSLIVVEQGTCPVNTDYADMRKKYRALVVCREWVLDSVSMYKLQTFDAYVI
ncbi:breast cancer type 1 susceptibility protein [Pelodytes ibericus]